MSGLLPFGEWRPLPSGLSTHSPLAALLKSVGLQVSLIGCGSSGSSGKQSREIGRCLAL
jgi:hypothetical protein